VVGYTVDQEIQGKGRIQKTVVFTDSSNYRLQIFGKTDGGTFEVFNGEPFAIHFEVSNNGEPIYITGKSGYFYESLHEHRIDSRAQYVEVGAGLGGFIPGLVNIYFGSEFPKPIVIDPADYSVMRDMIHFAKGLDFHYSFSDVINDRLSLLEYRCGVYMDSSRVCLVNMNLGDALLAFPGLEGSADFVIENTGPVCYSFTEEEDILKLEERLLKKGGQVLSSRV